MKIVRWTAAMLAFLLFALGAYAIRFGAPLPKSRGFADAADPGPGWAARCCGLDPTSGMPRPTTFVGGSLLSVARDGPLAGNRVPVVLISHGNGGTALSHVDLAMNLASAGYVVAAPTHNGDSFADQGRQPSPALFNQRAEELRSTLDYVLETWPGAPGIDPERVGAYGMSAGAFTVLIQVGAEHCRRTPEFICKVLE